MLGSRLRLPANRKTCEYRNMADQLNWQEIGARLRQARLAMGYTQDELGDHVGLARDKIAKSEAGVRHLTALDLTRLAPVLGVPMSYFLTQPPSVLSRRTELVDEQSTDAARNSFRLDAELTVWLRDIRQLIDCGSLKPRPLLRYYGAVADHETARNAAMWLRDEIGLDAEPLEAMVDVAERVGQLILVTDTPGEGASAVDGEIAAAVVSTHQDPARRRATAAHELGHLILGDEYSSDIGVHSPRDERERLIDAFASEFLLPRKVIPAKVREGTAEDVRRGLITLSARYRASWSLTLRQAASAGVIDAPQKSLLSARKPTHAEFMQALGWVPQPDFESIRVPPSVADAVLHAVQQKRITPRRATELTRGQIQEADLLGDLEEGYSGASRS